MAGYDLLIWIEFIPWCLLAPHCEPDGFYDGGDSDDSDDDDGKRYASVCFQYLQELESQSPSPMRPLFPTLSQIFDNASRTTARDYGNGVQTLSQWPVQISRMSSTIPLFKSMCQVTTPYANSVPLDYANPAAGTTQIVIALYQATILPRRGSIFANPGSHLHALSC